jgi:hypothetical protein
MAATAAQRLGRRPASAHLDPTRLHGAGRSTSAEEPEAQVVHITQGSSRDPRPDRNHVLLELSSAHPAGRPVLMKPLRGQSRDAHACGHVIRPPSEPWRTTSAATSLVADSAL